MLFNSFEFLLFFPVVFIVYYLLNHKYRWVFLLVVSYYFYMNWEPIYALLIFLSTCITFFCSIKISSSTSDGVRKLFMWLAVLSNFGILFLFKYYNFITGSVDDLLGILNIKTNFPEFSFLLPVGISFYTFQAVGYTIDVYNRKIKSENHFGKYALFVSYFPQLIAGPIERSSNLIPQLHKKVQFNFSKAMFGTKLIIWGYFMKVVVGDRLGIYVDSVYNNVEVHSSYSLITATVFFSFQIYCDFAGYSNIAIGCSKLLGIDLMTNFRRPYFSKSPVEFWRRWHISLSTWFKDYVYIPLGGSRTGKLKTHKNLLVTFLISGLWHGANWTYVFWGALNGFYQIIFSSKKRKIRKADLFFKNFIGIVFTFLLISFTWIFFRANSVSDAFQIINSIFTKQGQIFIGGNSNFIMSVFGISLLIVKEIYDEYFKHNFDFQKKSISWIWYLTLIILILMIGVFDGSQFIYFQF